MRATNTSPPRGERRSSSGRSSRKKLKLFEMCFLLMGCDKEAGITMNNSMTRAVSIIALAMSMSVVGPDDAMAREKGQTGASTRTPLNFSLRNRGNVRPTSNSPIAFNEAWAEYYSTPGRTRSPAHPANRHWSVLVLYSRRAKTLQCEFTKSPPDVSGRTQRPGQRAQVRRSSLSPHRQTRAAASSPAHTRRASLRTLHREQNRTEMCNMCRYQ